MEENGRKKVTDLKIKQPEGQQRGHTVDIFLESLECKGATLANSIKPMNPSSPGDLYHQSDGKHSCWTTSTEIRSTLLKSAQRPS